MNLQLLIDSVVRQTTVLIAQLATSGGARAPLAHVANQVFVELARELDEQGVSRKVSADMFGMALRAYQRKLRRLSQSSTEQGQSLWEAILEFVRGADVRTRVSILERFHRDDPEVVAGILRDLTDTALVFSMGTGRSTVYRAATASELGSLHRLGRGEGFEELVWAVIYREGPLSLEQLAARAGSDTEDVRRVLSRLESAGRVRARERDGLIEYESDELVLPMDDPAGWEAAVFDHYQAVVQTICARLRDDGPPVSKAETGGSTYTFDVTREHPLADEVYGMLARFRESASELRARVEAHNREHGLAASHDRVVVYGGQTVIAREAEDEEEKDAT